MAARKSRRLPKGVLIPLIAAGLAAAALWARWRTERSRDSGGMTDVGYMRAIHDALRRDMAHLESVTRTVDATTSPPAALTEGWTEFRGWLDRHHRAEDDDLWPVLRRHLDAPEDQHEVDIMLEEHRTLTATIDDSTQHSRIRPDWPPLSAHSARPCASTSSMKSAASSRCSNGTSHERSGERSCSPNAAAPVAGPTGIPGLGARRCEQTQCRHCTLRASPAWSARVPLPAPAPLPGPSSLGRGVMTRAGDQRHT
jgi:Hemerythrin HHE cation binding domain